MRATRSELMKWSGADEGSDGPGANRAAVKRSDRGRRAEKVIFLMDSEWAARYGCYDSQSSGTKLTPSQRRRQIPPQIITTTTTTAASHQPD